MSNSHFKKKKKTTFTLNSFFSQQISVWKEHSDEIVGSAYTLSPCSLALQEFSTTLLLQSSVEKSDKRKAFFAFVFFLHGLINGSISGNRWMNLMF